MFRIVFAQHLANYLGGFTDVLVFCSKERLSFGGSKCRNSISLREERTCIPVRDKSSIERLWAVRVFDHPVGCQGSEHPGDYETCEWNENFHGKFLFT